MKKILLCLALTLPVLANAQIVNIPDAVLKERIVTANAENYFARDSNGDAMIVDTNGDGEIQVSEALAVYELQVGGGGEQLISDATGVQAFENLKVLAIGSSNLTILDVSGMENLEVLRAGYNPLTELILTGCTSLTELECGQTELESLDLTGINSLTKLEVYDTEISALDLSGVNLTSLYFSGNPIVELDLSNQTYLEGFTVADCYDLVSVNIQNGILDYINVDTFYSCESLMHICVDEDEVESVYNTVIQSPGISDDIVVTANCEATAAVEGHEPDNTVKMYPNPVKDNLNIMAGHVINSIELYDLQGRLLQTALVKGTDTTINLSGRAAGVYFVKVATERGVKVEKILNE